MPDLINRYVQAVLEGRRPSTHAPASTPEQLVGAAAEALNAAGAGLTLNGPLRIPFAATSDEVRHTEQLETTLGTGPSLEAAAAAHPVTADTATLRRRWPLYLDVLLEQTPFRSVVSLPLVWPGGAEPVAALDLYYADPEPEPALSHYQTQYVVSTVTTVLLLQDLALDLQFAEPGLGATMPEPARARMTVWTASGMVMAATGSDELDSLALMRAHAFSRNLTLDALARQLVDGRVPVDDLTTSQ